MTNEDHLIGRADIERIQSLSEQELDQLPFGAIRLDRDGTILSYNQAEADLSGRKKERVIGKSFFAEVAPCTNVQEFAGRYRQGMEERKLDTTFPYRFRFPNRVVDVEITLILSSDSESAWVFVKEASMPIV